MRCLWLGDDVPVRELDAALPSVGVDGLAALGVIERAGGEARPLLTIRPHAFADVLGTGEWWIASDLDELSGVRPLRERHVLGVGGAARTLARLLPRVAAGAALDLGTGCGIIALHLRRFAERVVATDVSERALRIAALTLALNDVDGVELRRGSLFAPVAGERFDLVASNPPFVITPRAEGVPAFEYRDGGRAGDALMASVVSGAAAHLAPGGQARMLGNWESTDAARGLERALAWADPSLDAWVLEREALSPVDYAELWLRDGGTLPSDDGHDALLDAWLDDFAARGTTGIGMGWVALRAPAAGDPAAAPTGAPTGAPTCAPATRRAERIPHSVDLAHVGAHLADALETEAALARLDDDALADARLTTAPDVTEARHQRPGAEGPNVIELRQGSGLGRTISVDPALAALVGACDGELAVGALIAAIAELLEVDAAALRADLLPRVRELVRTGFLQLPAEPAPAPAPAH